MWSTTNKKIESNRQGPTHQQQRGTPKNIDVYRRITKQPTEGCSYHSLKLSKHQTLQCKTNKAVRTIFFYYNIAHLSWKKVFSSEKCFKQVID